MEKLNSNNSLKESLILKELKVNFLEEIKEKEKSPSNIDIQRRTKKSLTKIFNERDLEDEEKKKIIHEIPKETLTYIMTIVPQLLLNTISLFFLGHSDSSMLQANCSQIGLTMLNIVGVDLAIGSMSAFDLMGGKAFLKDKSALIKIYHEARIFCLLIFLLLILPFGYSGDYIMYFLGMNEEISETTGNYMKISLIFVIFSILYQLNVRLMYLNMMSSEVLFTNIFLLGFHTVLCMIFITTYSMGACGAAIALSISNVFAFLITSYILSSDSTISEESFIMVDTNSLSSSKFYYYAVLGSKFAFFSAVRHLPRNLIIIGSLYLNWVDLTTNCMLYNYIGIFTYFIVGYGISLNKTIFNLVGEPAKLRNYYIKIYIITGVIICFIISLFIFFSRGYICHIYIGDNFNLGGVILIDDVCTKISHIVGIYSVFIIFDWINNNCVAILKALNKYKTTNLVASGMQISIFLPLALILTYTYGLGYAGMWYSAFSSSLIVSIINLHYILGMDFKKACEIVNKEKINYKRDDHEIN